MIKTYLLKCFVLFFACMFLLTSCEEKRSGKPLVLVFSKTAGFHHKSIAKGNEAILKLAKENDFDIDTTTNADWFNEDTLKKYSAVIFLSTTGDLLNHYQEADFERYIQAGGGFVGIHGAADAEYDWGWYGRLVGGYFKNHPKIQEAKLDIVDKKHLSTKHLPDPWMHTDEWYNFKKLSKDFNVLINLDESSYKGGSNGKEHPIAWYQEFDGGRSFYTGLGHTDEAFADSLFLTHLLGGIKYAIGKNLVLDFSKATTLRVPEEERFSKTVLAEGEFFEPTEMAILPNLDILVAQRRGELMLYNQGTKELAQVGFLNVYFQAEVPKVRAEEGFMGLAADPDFENNNFIYAFYSPADTSVNRLSRFEFKDNKLNMESEKIVLEFYSQRNICCHTGGSITFGKDGLLYLSTGDNATPFNEAGQPYVNRGFAPLDVRPGHEQYDAARTSGNSNDLRGKILRIKVNEDGSYDIPEGNLFPIGEAKTKPEIYVMGNRNPYRISIDKKNNYLYWGEVGPDAKADSLETRGPKGYDEINQARQAGFFGWPFFVGDNYAYRAYDYATGKSGAIFDPNKPINNSSNNTGIKELPVAQPAFIWYPYDASKDFPQVGTGGRNAMAGPVYYPDLYDKETRYPDYYNEKLFIYDWVRGWIKAVTMTVNKDFDKMEPFVSHIGFAAPIDMEVGPDGRIYILEYGKGWFTKNPDAKISRIDYTAAELPAKVIVTTVKEEAKGEESYDNLDKAGEEVGHQEFTDSLKGKSLILASDCQSCHNEDRKSVGPTYKEIAKRYKDESGAIDLLAKKIIEGSGGVWGEVFMPPHREMKEVEAKEIVKWILSL
jgi:glucose/arabinose dehydrogenase/cytochrome c551/c552/type 1 glutamine amidotransferase